MHQEFTGDGRESLSLLLELWGLSREGSVAAVTSQPGGWNHLEVGMLFQLQLLLRTHMGHMHGTSPLAWVSSQPGSLGAVRWPTGQLRASKRNVSVKRVHAETPG